MNPDVKPDMFWDRLKSAVGPQSNRALAEKCDVSEGTIRRYLRGETYPSLDTLRAIAEATDCNLAWLASGEGPMRRGEAASASLGQPAPAQSGSSLETAAHAAFDALGVVEGMGLLTKIYSSGDQVFIRAINANLMAFGDAIENRAKAETTINAIREMREQMNVMRGEQVELKGQLASLRDENQELQRKLLSRGDREQQESAG